MVEPEDDHLLLKLKDFQVSNVKYQPCDSLLFAAFCIWKMFFWLLIWPCSFVRLLLMFFSIVVFNISLTPQPLPTQMLQMVLMISMSYRELRFPGYVLLQYAEVH